MIISRVLLAPFLSLSMALIILGCEKSTEETISDLVESPIADPNLAAIQETIDGLYASIHVKDGQLPDMDHLLSHFAPEARLGAVSNGATALKSATEYFEGWKSGMEQFQPDLLEEFEIEGKSQYFGNIAYHTSLYGVHVNTRDSLVERGIMNYQLVKLGEDWKVLSMIWQSEKDGNTIPNNYFNP
jgi:hypothetical protein